MGDEHAVPAPGRPVAKSRLDEISDVSEGLSLRQRELVGIAVPNAPRVRVAGLNLLHGHPFPRNTPPFVEPIILDQRDLSITDDELMTLRGTHSLINLYENAPREVERIAPADFGVRRLGHFGPFRSEHEAELWPRMADWISALASPRTA